MTTPGKEAVKASSWRDLWNKQKPVKSGHWFWLVVVPAAGFYGQHFGTAIRELLEWIYS